MTGQGPGNGLRQGAAAAAVGAAVALIAVFGLGRGSPPDRTPAGRSVRYNLYTHCGVSEARLGSQYYVAVHPLSDGAGNPPAGWDNPYDAGTMTLVSATQAVFSDGAGHSVVFRVRPGAKAFLRVCS
jgi:hypothetical protein